MIPFWTTCSHFCCFWKPKLLFKQCGLGFQKRKRFHAFTLSEAVKAAESGLVILLMYSSTLFPIQTPCTRPLFSRVPTLSIPIIKPLVPNMYRQALLYKPVRSSQQINHQLQLHSCPVPTLTPYYHLPRLIQASTCLSSKAPLALPSLVESSTTSLVIWPRRTLAPRRPIRIHITLHRRRWRIRTMIILNASTLTLLVAPRRPRRRTMIIYNVSRLTLLVSTFQSLWMCILVRNWLLFDSEKVKPVKQGKKIGGSFFSRG